MTTTRAANLACAAFALSFAFGLKSFYSRASFDELLWVLEPTTRVVEWMTGASFEREAGRAFLSRGHLYEIAPACAGVNFMIAAFCSLVLGLVHTRRTLLARVDLLLASAAAAYAATLVANATRIAIAMRLHDAGASFASLTPERLHAAMGTAVYFAFLCAVFALGARLAGARRELAI